MPDAPGPDPKYQPEGIGLRALTDAPQLLRLRIEKGYVAPRLGPPRSSLTEWRDPSRRIAARGRVYDSGAWIDVSSVATYWWVGGLDVVWGVPHPQASPEDVTDSFNRTVLPFLLQLKGLQCLHASAVVAPGGVVAICGASGVGKSTMAVALERYGHAVWADDALAFRASAGSAVAVRLPFRRRLLPASHQLLATLPPLPEPLAPPFDPELEIAGLVVLERGAEVEPVFELLPPAGAFQAVVEHCYSFALDSLDARRLFSENQLELAVAAPAIRVRFAPAASFRTLVERITRWAENPSRPTTQAGEAGKPYTS